MPGATGVSSGQGLGHGDGLPIMPPSGGYGDLAHPAGLDSVQRSLGTRVDASPAPRKRGQQEIIIDQLFALLRSGQVEDFNKLRPSGPIDLRGRDFSGLSLRGVDFRNANLARALFHGCDLSEAKFQQAILDRADLSETVLTRAKFYEASLRFAQLEAVKDAFNAEFHKAKLKSATLDGGNFSGAIFNEAQLVGSSLVRTRFHGAQLVDAKLMGATLTEAVFENANMQRVRLFQANGRDVSFKNASLLDGEAVASYFTSSSDDIEKPNRLNFDGAWIKGFRQNGEIPEVLLALANRRELPPEGTFTAVPPPSVEKILVNGIPGSDKVLYDQALSELDELIGLEEVKSTVKKLMNHLMVSQVRLELGEPELDYVLHAIYLGPPGTGKTSVARIVAKLLYAVGAMPTDRMVEASRPQLVAEFQGQTAKTTDRVVDSAIGGTLVVDEAYGLKISDNDSYGAESIATLVKRLEDDRKKFVCIMTGYEHEMEQFLEVNSGLKSRFPFRIMFDHYNTGQLIDIMKLMLDKKHFRYTQEVLGDASVLIAAAKAIEQDKFGNGRTVRNTYEATALHMSERLVEEGLLQKRDREQLLTVKAGDLPFESIIKIPRSEIPPLADLRWKHPGRDEELSIDQIDLDGEFPCLTKASFLKVAEAIKAFRQEKRTEKAEEDFI